MSNVIPLEDARNNGLLSAAVGRAKDFNGGWGSSLSFKTKPHWFEVLAWCDDEGPGIYMESLCGLKYALDGNAYVSEAGNFPKCKRCMAALTRRNLQVLIKERDDD